LTSNFSYKVIQDHSRSERKENEKKNTNYIKADSESNVRTNTMFFYVFACQRIRATYVSNLDIGGPYPLTGRL